MNSFDFQFILSYWFRFAEPVLQQKPSEVYLLISTTFVIVHSSVVIIEFFLVIVTVI